MPYKHSCFISYVHAEGALMKPFIEELKEALDAYTEPFLEQKAYIDSSGLKPGALFLQDLAQAIGESICMVVVYVPKYERHPFCLREFAAMEMLEECRNKLRGGPAKIGLILPIIFRQAADIPEKISSGREYADFTRYTTASGKILNSESHVAKVEEIAKRIYEIFEAFEQFSDYCKDCPTFHFPEETEVKPWRAPKAPPAPYR